MKHRNNFLRQQRLFVDFKDENGIDKHVPVYILRNAQATDKAIVWALKDQVEQSGCKLSAVSDGLRCLYLPPAFWKNAAVRWAYRFHMTSGAFSNMPN